MRIVFCYPEKKIGGAQLLFIRCAQYFSTLEEVEVFYIDYIDGFARKMLERYKVSFLDYNDNKKVTLPQNSVSVLALEYINEIFERFVLSQNNRFLFWSIHPANMTGKICMPYTGWYIATPKERKNIGVILKNMVSIGMVWYMDYTNYISDSKAFFFRAEPDYLPIFVEDKFFVSSSNSIRQLSPPSVSFMWLGRLDTDKANTIIMIMNELEELNKILPVKLFIVGDGTRKENIESEAMKHSYQIEILGIVYGEGLNRIIDQNVDIGIAMGTSALEIAKRAKPVIMKGIIKNSEIDRHFEDYIILSEEYKYSMASPVFCYEGQTNFVQKVNEIIDNYHDKALVCYQYAKDNHSQSHVCSKLLLALQELEKKDNVEMLKLIADLTGRVDDVLLRKLLIPIKNLISK